MGGRKRRHGSRHRCGELAEGSARRTRLATRARRPGSDAAIEGTPGQSYVHGAAAADVGDAERANARTGDDRWKRKRSAINSSNDESHRTPAWRLLIKLP